MTGVYAYAPPAQNAHLSLTPRNNIMLPHFACSASQHRAVLPHALRCATDCRRRHLALSRIKARALAAPPLRLRLDLRTIPTVALRPTLRSPAGSSHLLTYHAIFWLSRWSVARTLAWHCGTSFALPVGLNSTADAAFTTCCAAATALLSAGAFAHHYCFLSSPGSTARCPHRLAALFSPPLPTHHAYRTRRLRAARLRAHACLATSL